MIVEPSERSEFVTYPIRDIVLEAKVYEKQGKKMTYLNVGDPSPFGFKPPEHITTAIKEALDNPLYTGYSLSAGDDELREAIAKKEKAASSKDVFVTTGLSEGVEFLYTALIDRGDSILLPNPVYPMYWTKEKVSYGGQTFYDCDDSTWEPNLDSMRKTITEKTKAILVISPNNPTGAVYSRKTLEGIVDIAGEYKLPIIADDAYEHIIFEGEHLNMRNLHKDVPLISGNSMSKNYLYPGARVGWLTFHGEGLEKIKDATQRLCNQRLSVNWEMQKGAVAALRGSLDHIKDFNNVMRKRRDLIVQRINNIEGLSLSAPKGAFYAFVKIDDLKGCKDDWAFVRELLKEGVVVVPGSGFTPIKNAYYFRIVLLPPEDQINSAFDKIAAFMRK